MIYKTKFDGSFPTSQFFMINGFSTPFRLDQNDKGGGIILYIREDIRSRLVSTESSQVEGFFRRNKFTKQEKVATLLLLESKKE